MSITDTQILSYYYKGSMPQPEEQLIISSITASEFLLVQSSNANKANYYPLLPHGLFDKSLSIGPYGFDQSVKFDSKKHSARGRHRTDEILVNLNGEIPPFLEFGSFALSEIINHHRGGLFASSIHHLRKPMQKKLKKRFRFLVESNVQCIPLTEDIVHLGLEILAKFLKNYNAKINHRNTVNDVLILATAISQSRPILTNDQLLARFAATLFNVTPIECEEKLAIDFSGLDKAQDGKKIESKGFIQRGWEVNMRRRAHI